MTEIEPFPDTLLKSKALGTPYVLTEAQAEWLRRYYPDTSTHTLAALMGCSFQSVLRIAKRYGIAKDRQALRKCLSDIQHGIIRSERLRDKWCLPRRTTYYLPCKIYTKREIKRRWKAKKEWGYIPGDYITERFILFYDKQTNRNKKFEANSIKAGFEIKEIKTG